MAALVRLLTFLALLSGAPAAADGVEVDVELLLMVDVSRSMTPHELEIQRRGYAEALRSGPVLAAVRSGGLGRIAVSFVEWSGGQEVVVPWRLLETGEDLAGFAQEISTGFVGAMRRTSISGALSFGAASIEGNDFEGRRRVIDISGDGPNNLGAPVDRARDAVLAQGITINGLPLMTREGMGDQWHLDDLDIYYWTCVTGGPGSFVIPVTDWEGFASAVRRKLVLEIAAIPLSPARILPIAGRDPTDCQVGEQIWNDRRLDWSMP